MLNYNLTCLKVRLILGNISLADLGMWCSQKVFVVPDIKSNVP